MAAAFDVYHHWLGIPPDEQPPDHYRLLGIERGQRDTKVVALACQRRMALVKTLAVGPHAESAQDLLNQLARAKACLLNPARKLRYDGALEAGLVAESCAAVAAPTQPAPSGPPPLPASTRSWLIGSARNCDLVVRERTVSRRHCRLTQRDGHYFLEDLGSRNGTLLNGRVVTSHVPVCRADRVQLGRHVDMPWPAEVPPSSFRLIRIVAAPDNEVILDFPVISWHHAVIRIDGDAMTLEDLGSTNGTYLGSPSNGIRKTRLLRSDLVYFGVHAMTAEKLLEA